MPKSPPTAKMLRPAKSLAAVLLQWFDAGAAAARDMPWRKTRDSYAIWISEIMLQQTQVQTVKPYYQRFLARFPTIAALAAADLDDVLQLWAGLGYYRRAKLLHQAAQEIMKDFAGKLPETPEQLRELPGFGPYTAGAVASIAFQQRAPAVDGNVIRVLSRLTAFDADASQPRHRSFFQSTAAQILRGAPPDRAGDVNQALMELGATICSPQPRCDSCPAAKFCRARSQGRQSTLPRNSKKNAVREIHGDAIILLRSRCPGSPEVLLMRRATGGLWAGLWEFPILESNSKIDLRRRITQQLAAAIGPIIPCGELRHDLTHRRLHLRLHYAQFKSNQSLKCPPLPPAYCESRWVPWPPQTAVLAISRITAKIIEKIADTLSTNS